MNHMLLVRPVLRWLLARDYNRLILEWDYIVLKSESTSAAGRGEKSIDHLSLVCAPLRRRCSLWVSERERAIIVCRSARAAAVRQKGDALYSGTNFTLIYCSRGLTFACISTWNIRAISVHPFNLRMTLDAGGECPVWGFIVKNDGLAFSNTMLILRFA